MNFNDIAMDVLDNQDIKEYQVKHQAARFCGPEIASEFEDVLQEKKKIAHAAIVAILEKHVGARIKRVMDIVPPKTQDAAGLFDNGFDAGYANALYECQSLLRESTNRLEDSYGIDPNFTDGKSVTNFLNERRSGEVPDDKK